MGQDACVADADQEPISRSMRMSFTDLSSTRLPDAVLQRTSRFLIASVAFCCGRRDACCITSSVIDLTVPPVCSPNTDDDEVLPCNKGQYGDETSTPVDETPHIPYQNGSTPTNPLPGCKISSLSPDKRDPSADGKQQGYIQMNEDDADPAGTDPSGCAFLCCYEQCMIKGVRMHGAIKMPCWVPKLFAVKK
jgi:hypothetical protein